MPSDTMNKAFSATVIALCEKRKINQCELTSLRGDATKIDQGSLSKILRGKRRAQPDVAAKIIACFHGSSDRRELLNAYLSDVTEALADALRPPPTSQARRSLVESR